MTRDTNLSHSKRSTAIGHYYDCLILATETNCTDEVNHIGSGGKDYVIANPKATALDGVFTLNFLSGTNLGYHLPLANTTDYESTTNSTSISKSLPEGVRVISGGLTGRIKCTLSTASGTQMDISHIHGKNKLSGCLLPYKATPTDTKTIVFGVVGTTLELFGSTHHNYDGHIDCTNFTMALAKTRLHIGKGGHCPQTITTTTLSAAGDRASICFGEGSKISCTIDGQAPTASCTHIYFDKGCKIAKKGDAIKTPAGVTVTHNEFDLKGIFTLDGAPDLELETIVKVLTVTHTSIHTDGTITSASNVVLRGCFYEFVNAEGRFADRKKMLLSDADSKYEV